MQNKPEWQLCHICEGDGEFISFHTENGKIKSSKCLICNGTKVLNTKTHNPPSDDTVVEILKNVLLDIHTSSKYKKLWGGDTHE